jgi:hypothetical protein
MQTPSAETLTKPLTDHWEQDQPFSPPLALEEDPLPPPLALGKYCSLSGSSAESASDGTERCSPIPPPPILSEVTTPTLLGLIKAAMNDAMETRYSFALNCSSLEHIVSYLSTHILPRITRSSLRKIINALLTEMCQYNYDTVDLLKNAYENARLIFSRSKDCDEHFRVCATALLRNVVVSKKFITSAITSLAYVDELFDTVMNALDDVLASSKPEAATTTASLCKESEQQCDDDYNVALATFNDKVLELGEAVQTTIVTTSYMLDHISIAFHI